MANNAVTAKKPPGGGCVGMEKRLPRREALWVYCWLKRTLTGSSNLKMVLLASAS